MALRSVLAMATLVALLLAPGVVHACSSDHPTFAEAVDGASAIARVIVTDVPAYGEDRDSHAETYRVVRTLKGSLPDSAVLEEPFTSLCHDTIGGLVAPEGSEAIVAFDVAYFGQVIHPAWVAVDAPYRRLRRSWGRHQVVRAPVRCFSGVASDEPGGTADVTTSIRLVHTDRGGALSAAHGARHRDSAA